MWKKNQVVLLYQGFLDWHLCVFPIKSRLHHLVYPVNNVHFKKVQELTSSLVYHVRMDEGRQPLSRKLPISSSKINPYRMIILLRLIILGLFFHYRILHPVHDAYALWMTSVVCEIWFALSWILDQFPKWYPIERETYLERLSLRYVRLVCTKSLIYLFSSIQT